jgi:hypothetical protein
MREMGKDGRDGGDERERPGKSGKRWGETGEGWGKRWERGWRVVGERCSRQKRLMRDIQDREMQGS